MDNLGLINCKTSDKILRVIAIAPLVLFALLAAPTMAEQPRSFSFTDSNGQQLTFDADFDNGNLLFVSQKGNLFTVGPGFWLHFRVAGVASTTPEFRTQQLGNPHYVDSHRMVFRYGGEDSWQPMDTGYLSDGYYHFGNSEPFAADTVYIAYWHPRTFEQTVVFMERMEDERNVRNAGARGFSPEGRPVYGFEVTDPYAPDKYKEHVVILHQHSLETPGAFIMEGMAEYLISSSEPEAEYLRQTVVFHFYPLVMPDVLHNGYESGPNSNRVWHLGAPRSNETVSVAEVDIVRQAILDETDGNAAFALDFHAHPGHVGDCYYWGLQSGPVRMVDAAYDFVERVHERDRTCNDGQSIISNSIGSDLREWTKGPPADMWLYKTLGAVSFTVEPGSMPMHSIERLKKLGVSFGRGLADVMRSHTDRLASQQKTIDVSVSQIRSLRKDTPDRSTARSR